jgi:uncharacterized alkaline shock family protein YloU
LTVTTELATSQTHRPVESADRVVPAGDRGRLEISPRAVQRLVAAAAAEVDAAGGSVSRVFGQTLGSANPDALPQVKATISGDLVTAEVSMSVPWPFPVSDVTDRVRKRVQKQLYALAALRVSHVDITVTALPQGRRRRRVD